MQGVDVAGTQDSDCVVEVVDHQDLCKLNVANAIDTWFVILLSNCTQAMHFDLE